MGGQLGQCEFYLKNLVLAEFLNREINVFILKLFEKFCKVLKWIFKYVAIKKF